MAITAVEICSRALVRLGAEGIQSFTDGTDRATAASSVYSGIVDAELSMYPWRFAMKKATLSQLTDTPTNEYKYAYQLPTDRIGDPFAVFRSTGAGAQPVKGFEVFGDKIFSNDTSLTIDYPFKPSEASFPAYFVEFLVLALASHLAMPITDQSTKADYFRSLAYGTPSEAGNGGALLKARHANSAQQPPQGITDFALIDARYR